MKNFRFFFTLFLLLIIYRQSYCQAPQYFKYQGICRDNSGNILQDQPADIRLSIHDQLPAGAIVYQEIFSVTTNSFGLILLDVGSGNVQSGSFNTIPWETGDKFLEIEMDMGTGYISYGITQLLSVPYALHSKTAESITGAITETDPLFIVSPANGITAPDINNWNTVYGWGDHSVAGYLLSEIDGSVTNEIQALSISNDTVYLSNGGFVKLPAGFNGQYSSLTGAPTSVSSFTNDAGYLTSFTEIDGSVTNEIQALSISNDTVYLSNGGFVKLPAGFNGQYSSLTGAPTDVSSFTNDAGYLISFTEVDGSVTNEIQALSISNDTVYLSNGGFVKLPATAWTLLGNSGTIAGTDFIGTKDNVPLQFRVNNTQAGLINDADHITFFGYQAGLNNNGNTANSAFGYHALYSNTTGSSNNANGVNSLFANTTGYNNTAFGVNTLSTNTTGYQNTAIGQGALYDNTTGYSNTAIGELSLRYNTNGVNNTANGRQVLFSNTTGNHNTASGVGAMYSNSTGEYNTATGVNALNANSIGNQNTASGVQALFSNTSGSANTADGQYALLFNTIGSRNTASGLGTFYYNVAGSNGVAIGYYSQYYANNTATAYDNTNTSVGYQSLRGSVSSAANTGISNTAIGRDALFSNSSGSLNTANGYQALYANTTGNSNTAGGEWALRFNTSGSFNTAYGMRALVNNTAGTYNTANGWGALFANTTGSENTASGNRALYMSNTGNFNTAIGNSSLYNSSAGSNGVAIGYYSQYNANSAVSAWDNTNTSIGYQSLRGSTNPAANTGVYNTAIGRNALLSNSSGTGNTANGYQTLQYSTTGTGNTANGYIALQANSTGSYNTANGFQSLVSNTIGIDNTAIGHDALYFNTSGNNNTAIGVFAGNNNVSGSYNVFIGHQAGFNELGSNKLYIANSSVNPPLIYGDFSTGNVGIGTNVPNARLDLGIGYGASGEKLIIYNDNTSGPLAGTKTGFYLDRFSLQNNVTFVFPTAPAFPGSYMIAKKNTAGTTLVSLMTILGESGNVGIGTTAPAALLHVNSTSTSDDVTLGKFFSALNVDGYDNNIFIGKSLGAGQSAVFGYIYSTTINNSGAYITVWGDIPGTTGLFVRKGGNIGIGTTAPGAKLEVNGQVKITGGAPGAGKVLTSDGIGLATWETPAFAFTHYIGEAKDGGIIFYIYRGSDGLEHGLIVALTESSAEWQSVTSLVNADRSWDGVFNTGLMINSPAETYVTGLGAGWYLPSSDEISLLWHNRFHVNKAMNDGGFALLATTGAYWSSMEYNTASAWAFSFHEGRSDIYTKTVAFPVRAIRAF